MNKSVSQTLICIQINDLIYKKFYRNLWVFDLSLKSNTFITKIEQLPKSLKVNIAIPLLPFYAEGSAKVRLILNSLKLISVIIWKKAFFTKSLLLQKNKKWVHGGVISSTIFFSKNFSILPLLNLVAFPYIWLSEGLSHFLLVSDNSGNLNFSFKEISFLSRYLDEWFIDWNKTICFNLILKQPPFFFKFKSTLYLESMINRVLWSSLSFKCLWGHGAWSNIFVVSKLYKLQKFHFIKKNFFI